MCIYINLSIQNINLQIKKGALHAKKIKMEAKNMKKEQKRGNEANLRSDEGFTSIITSLWFFALAFMLDLARALKIQRIFEPRKTSFSQAVSNRKYLLVKKDYKVGEKKMVKKGLFNYFKILAGMLILVNLMPQIFAADPGHVASSISAGLFEGEGNFTFPDSLFIEEYFNVSDNLFIVDPLTRRVGIGTTSPGYMLQVEGATNTSYLIVNNLAHIGGNVTMSDNLTIGGNRLYVDASSGKVGIGTTSPAAVLEVTNTSAADLLLNITQGGVPFVYNASAGRVGIGAMNPGVRLVVNGPLSSSTNFPFNVMFMDSAAAAQNVGGGLGFGGNADDDRVFAAIQGGHESSTASNYDGYLRLFTRVNGESQLRERMRITSTGNVGIGTVEPSLTLEVVGDANLTGKTYFGNSSYISGNSNGIGIGTTNPQGMLEISNLTGPISVPWINVTDGGSGKKFVVDGGAANGIEIDSSGSVVIMLG